MRSHRATRSLRILRPEPDLSETYNVELTAEGIPAESCVAVSPRRGPQYPVIICERCAHANHANHHCLPSWRLTRRNERGGTHERFLSPAFPHTTRSDERCRIHDLAASLDGMVACSSTVTAYMVDGQRRRGKRPRPAPAAELRGPTPLVANALCLRCNSACLCCLLVQRAQKAAAAAIQARSAGIPFGPRRARTCGHDGPPPNHTTYIT